MYLKGERKRNEEKEKIESDLEILCIRIIPPKKKIYLYLIIIIPCYFMSVCYVSIANNCSSSCKC